MELTGQSFLGSGRGAHGGAAFQAVNPQTGEALPPVYHSATSAEVNTAAELAAEAFASHSQASGKAKAAFLRRVADGFDAHRDDPLAELRLNDETYSAIATRIRALAETHCEGRSLWLLEGGYDLRGLAASVTGCLRVLAA